MRHAPIDPALFTANRRRLAALLPPGAVAIIHAADVPPATGDGTLRYHPAEIGRASCRERVCHNV